MLVKRGTFLPDCHVHTSFSTDSEASPEEVIEQAIRLGMPVICITDHHDMEYPTGEFQLEIDAYLQKLAELRTRYADRIEVRCGIELGLQPHLAENIKTFTETYTFDYVIGSIHMVDGKDPYIRSDFDMSDEELYRRYFAQTLACVQTVGGYCALGHLDYIVRYGYTQAQDYSYMRYRELLDAILETLIERDIALEVNTAGFRKGLGFPNPHPDLLWRYRDLGGEKITLGSDAHTPADVGADFQKTAELLEAIGYRYITVFHEKEAVFVPLK